MKQEKKKPFLAWKKQDFLDNNQEVPDTLLNDEVHTEGEMMSENDIIDWICDTEKTFTIIREQDEARFRELLKDYKMDIEYLAKIGKIDNEVVKNILKDENFQF